ncbi:hypothetical protein BDF19DRAFT_439462 [Syncephalis fuscata]|nr:hypothetical protein BDF19DRAFT_439462 [Syncephalis fuscata]
MQLTSKTSLPNLPQTPMRFASPSTTTTTAVTVMEPTTEPATLLVVDELTVEETTVSTNPVSIRRTQSQILMPSPQMNRNFSQSISYSSSPPSSASASSSTSSLSLLTTTDAPAWLRFTDDEQLKILLVALETPQVRSNCIELFCLNTRERNYLLLTQLMNTCENPSSSYRPLLVRFGDQGIVTFREPFERLVDLVVSGMRRSTQSHLLAGHLCRLAARLCTREDHRLPRFREFSDVAKHLPILMNTAHLMCQEAADGRLEEVELHALLNSFFEHPLLSDFTLLNVGQSDLELPKLVAAEGILMTICAVASQPQRSEFLQELLVRLKSLRHVLDMRGRDELDRQIADSLQKKTRLNSKKSANSLKGLLLPEQIRIICYELLIDEQCNRTVAGIIQQLQHLYRF